MQLAKIITTIEKIAPPGGAAVWDNSGMQVAGRCEDITCVAVCLDPTPTAVERAADLGARLFVSHHPLLLTPRLPSESDAFHAVLSLLFRADMALYSAHTSLDAAGNGPAGWLVRELRLTGLKTLEPTPGGGALSGLGLVGDLPEALSFSQLLALLGRHLPLEGATLSGPALPPGTRIRRVACCPGSGGSLIGAARHAGADIYITGDIRYHSALDAPLAVLDVGHHPLEEEMTRRFAVLLRTKLRGVKTHFLPSANPIQPAVPYAGIALENTR